MRPPTIAPTLAFVPLSEGSGWSPFASVLVEVLASVLVLDGEWWRDALPIWVRVEVAVTRTHVEANTVRVGVGSVVVRTRVPLTVVVTTLVRVVEEPGRVTRHSETGMGGRVWGRLERTWEWYKHCTRHGITPTSLGSPFPGPPSAHCRDTTPSTDGRRNTDDLRQSGGHRLDLTRRHRPHTVERSFRGRKTSNGRHIQAFI